MDYNYMDGWNGGRLRVTACCGTKCPGTVSALDVKVLVEVLVEKQ